MPGASEQSVVTAERSQSVALPDSPEQLAEMMQAWMQVTQRVQRTHETLEAEVKRLRRELASKDRELERRRRLACLGELAAGVAHEVRNPLGAIRLYSSLLRNTCQKQDAALQLIEKIEAGIRAIDGVVQDTLSLAPRSSAQADCDLREVIQGASDLSQRSMQSRGVTLHVRGDAGAARVRGETAALQRVLLNLLINAAEASPPGSAVELDVSQPDGSRVHIRVLDRGEGLADEVLEKLFDPFFTTKKTGTGLGLTIAHRLIEAHGGSLTARNREGGGAVFDIALPIIEDTERNEASSEGAKRTTAA